MIIAMVSAKGSPGVTTTALASALSWATPVLLAECDPAGGDILTGYLSRLEIPVIGLLPLAVAALRGEAGSTWHHHLVDLDPQTPGRRLLLPGITDPAQAGTISPTWAQLAELFAGLERDPGLDIIADCGRLSSTSPPWPLLHRADLIVLILRPTSLRTVAPALPAATHLRRQLLEHGRGPGVLVLLLVGSHGRYSTGEIEARLRLPVLAHLPEDRRAAPILSDGGRLRGTPDLLRAAAAIEPVARRRIQALRAHLSYPMAIGHA